MHDITILRNLTFNFNGVTPLFLGPIIFLYVKSLFEDRPNFIRKNIVHFIPSILFVLFISTPVLIFLERGTILFGYVELIITHRLLMFVIFDVILVLYGIYTLRYFFNKKRTLKQNFSSLSDEDLNWVKNLLIGVVLLSAGHLLLAVFNPFSEIEYLERSHFTIIFIFILICYLGYHGINQSKMLIPYFLLDDIKAETENKQNYLSTLSGKELVQLKEKLESILVNDRPYLDENLTLTKLAQLIPISNKKLSIFLNQYLDTTFYDMINAYRITSVKEKLESDTYNHFTLLAIAFESGFNSKTTFNRIFKKETGLSPSEYKKRHQK